MEKKQNKLNKEIAEKSFLKRMKSLMLEENRVFNKDVLNGDFFIYAHNYLKGKKKPEKTQIIIRVIEVFEEVCRRTFQVSAR